jgi:hypothetical protein
MEACSPAGELDDNIRMLKHTSAKFIGRAQPVGQ